ncbi:transposase [Streptomyces achromogenes]|uniref:transposase n=1 Tax=Streptomyces achromogenes TaxID=67255 RepID=UPI003F4D2F6F
MLLIAAYWRTNLTLRQLAPLLGVSKSSADRIVGHLGPALALQPRRRFRKDTVLIADGTLVPTRDHAVAVQSKNDRYSTNHQVVIDADTRLVVTVGRPLPGNRNDCKAWELSGAKAAVGRTTVITDGGYRGTGLVIPHRRERGQSKLLAWKEEHNASTARSAPGSSTRAHLRPDEDLEDPPRLPPERRRRPPRRARYRTPAQPHPRRVTDKGTGHPHAVEHLRAALRQ